MNKKQSEKVSNRTEIVACRYTKSEKERIENQAKTAGYKVSNYIRKVVLNNKITPYSDIKTAYELNKIGVNINQIAKEIHIYRDDKNIEKSLIRLESLLNDIDTITKKLL